MSFSIAKLVGVSVALLGAASAQASNFTPEVLLSAPRRSEGMPNWNGELVLNTVSTYSFESHSQSSEIHVLNATDNTSHVVSKDSSAGSPVWISNTEIAFVKSGEDGSGTLLSMDVTDKSAKPHVIHHFGSGISSPKTKQLSDGKVAYVCAAKTTPSGELYWPAGESEALSSAMIYTSLFVRHWDTYLTDNHDALWYGQLSKSEDGHWAFDSSRFHNAMQGTNLSSPIPPFGGTRDFDIADHGIVFTAKDPELNVARYTKSDLYYVKIDSFADKPSAKPQMIKTGDLKGYSNAPAFSSDGSKLVFLRMRSIQYEADKNRIMLIPDMDDLETFEEFYEVDSGEGGWDLSPGWVIWGENDEHLYAAAEKHARTRLWKLPASPEDAKDMPKPVFEEGSLADARMMGKNGSSFFITSESLTDSSTYSILDLESNEIKQISSVSENGERFGLNHDQVSDIWFKGSSGYDMHALVMKPSDFDESKQYPLAFFIHGGPQGSWGDSWSTRWNPAVFAEQGYVVVLPNPTGSTGYGQDHVDAIQDNWGGSPYQDLVNCFKHLETIDYINTENAVALGASYGGYMINWIQGQDLAKKFKCLVCHDGVHSTLGQWSTEELWFPEHDFNGTIYDNREGYAKWDPAQYAHKWETPMLIIHGELDYRLPIAQSLTMFNVLQARNITSKMIVYPDENHWVLNPENSLVWHNEVIGWINSYSGMSS